MSVPKCFEWLSAVRTYVNSNLINIFDSKAEVLQHEMFESVNQILLYYAKKASLHVDEANAWFKTIQLNAFENSSELLVSGLGKATARIWTCAETSTNGNLSFHAIVNDILRADDEATVRLAIPFVACLNSHCVSISDKTKGVHWPDDDALPRHQL
jgi:hypothetical protein